MPNSSGISILEIRPAKDSEESVSNFTHFLASLNSSLRSSFLDRLLHRQHTISLEIACLNQSIYFIITCPTHLKPLIKSQIAAQYPTSIITSMKDYLPAWMNHGQVSLGQLSLSQPSYLPLNTVSESVPDHLAAVIGVLSRLAAGQAAIVQVVFSSAPKSWLRAAHSILNPPPPPPETPASPPHPQKAQIEQKVAHSIYFTDIRLVSIANQTSTSQSILSQIAGSFGVYTLSEGNSFVLKTPPPKNQYKLKQSILDRSLKCAPKGQYLNILELASVFHLPNQDLANLKNITWGKTLKGEPPQDLPVADFLSDQDKNKVNFFARTEFKNKVNVFGIKKGDDRRRHMYILGKSGTGKTTLIANMAIADIKKGLGVAVIDPHGDLSEILLDYIPKERVEDIVYLDPSTKDISFNLNPLTVKNSQHQELVVSSILSIFTKIWANVWSARMEYILRNTLLTLVERPGATLLDIPKLLTDPRFRNEYLDSVTDKVVHEFWKKEYDKYSERFQSEAISPILNKVGRFTTSKLIRNIVGHEHSTVDIEDLMNQGKIIILNLAQGKIGEDNTALLGAMFITQMQIAAMNRVYVPEEERKDFFLYVDEFQNFATESFVKILSEARKFRLNLILANQYTAQLPEEIQKAIFGNAGTVVTFVVGADDANRLINELGNQYTQDDLVSLGKYQVVVKLSIDSRISTPFPAYTLPIPDARNENRPKAIEASQRKYYKPVVENLFDPSDLEFTSSPTSRDKPAPPKEKPEVNKVYQGTVDNIKDYGIFVEFVPGLKGLVHVSNISKDFIEGKDIEEKFKKGDKVEVKLQNIDDQGRFDLTMIIDKKEKPKEEPKGKSKEKDNNDLS
jgi:predicted RNA-binding protein with RPS1 domain